MLPSDNTTPTGPLGIIPYLPPTHPATSRGGFNVYDGSLGLNIQDWVFYIYAGRIWAQKGTRVTVGTGTPVLELPAGVTELDILSLSGTFDRNMDPNLAWTTAEGAFFRWFNTEVGDYVITFFPGVTRILVTHDDVRDSSQADSDVIVTWLQGGRIYYAIQRERYTIQREVATERPGQVVELHNFGMTQGYRLQWEYTYATDKL